MIMEMVDMELSKSKENTKNMPCVDESVSKEKYPYGLRLNFETEQIKKIPALRNFQVGDKVMIHAECCITEKRVDEKRDNETRENLSVQIEKLAIMPKINKKPEDMNPKEYRSMREYQ